MVLSSSVSPGWKDASSTNGAFTAASEARERQLFRTTPLIFSDPLTKLCKNERQVYLKLDCLQASGSFKDRGMAHLCLQLVKERAITSIISSSGGNAGLAAATVARSLGLHCTVVVPVTTKSLVIDKLQSLGAIVHVFGENWNAADTKVRQMVAADLSGRTAYIPPYEHEHLWTGHSSVVDEIYNELPIPVTTDQECSSRRDVAAQATIIVSVGGGGLLCGVLQGLERHGRQSHVICAETVGASSFGQAWHQKQLVTLPAIESIATSLGALAVSASALERSIRHQDVLQLGTVASAVCTDAEAVDACLKVR